MKDKMFKSLRITHVIYFVASLFLSLVLLFSVNMIGNSIIFNSYLTRDAIQSRISVYRESFFDYVETNNLAITDVAELSQWMKNNPDVYMFIMDESGNLVYETGQWSVSTIKLEDNNKTETNEESGNDEIELMTPSETDPDDDIANLYDKSMFTKLHFRDGTYLIFMSETSEQLLFKLVKYTSVGTFLVSLITSQVFFTNYIIRRTKQLSDEVTGIEDGNINQPITRFGNDEISQLADHIDLMRDSLIKQTQREKELMTANNDLITALSHDLRTPLTALVGYLEVLDDNPDIDEEKRKEYIERSKAKTLQLKHLSDRMFQYFFVFDDSSNEIEMEYYNLHVLLEQLIYERVFDLETTGYDVTVELEESVGQILVNIHYLHRLFDNLFGNIQKYAMKDNVRIIGKVFPDGYQLSIKNKIDLEQNKTKGTNIGLKTCDKIISQLNGTFEVVKTEETFEVLMKIPFKKGAYDD